MAGNVMSVGKLSLAAALLLAGCGAASRHREGPPGSQAIEIRMVAEQWAWKAQHAGGRREMNELHLPSGQKVRLVITSRDVVHRLSIPGLRVSGVVKPGSVAFLSFNPGDPGEYHFYCTEYCGPDFSRMRGKVVVLRPRDYEQWLSGISPGETPLEAGRRLFSGLRCESCHRPDGAGRGPSLEGLFGRTVNLTSGKVLIAGDTYVRESILHPEAKLVSGYEQIMPGFEGRLSEEQLNGLLTYLRSRRGRTEQ